MKTLRCPLCGSLLKLDFNCKYICPSCELAAKCGISKEEALKRAEKLITQFPPIMRVWPGDEILCGSRPSPVTIISKNIECGEIKIRDCHGTYFIIDCDDVLAWPWEFEQK